MILTARDQEIIRALTRRVRIMTLELVCSTWWQQTDAAQSTARRRMTQLVEADWVGCRRVPTRPLLNLSEPVWTWRPGATAPDPHAISWRLQRRWTQPARQRVVYFATRRANERFGGAARGRIKNLSQVTHDLHVTLVYLNLLRQTPELALCWIGEDELAPERRHAKLPDAVLRDRQGHVFRVIEFGGAYSARRVLSFHNDCAQRGLPYELW